MTSLLGALPQGAPARCALCRHCGLPAGPERERAGSGAAFCCIGCRVAHALSAPSGPPAAPGGATGETGPSTLLLRLGAGIFLGMNVMVFSWLNYARDVFPATAGPDAERDLVASLFAYVLLLLSTLVVATLGMPLLAESFSSRSRWRALPRLDANLLIALGVGAAYVLSVVHTLRGEGGLYYDTAAGILVLVTLGRHLEAGARRRAVDSARMLVAEAPQRAWAERSGGVLELDADGLVPGDRVRVRPGESVPVDGRVREGRTHVDESSLTGESRPRAVETGSDVLAGSVSLDGQIWVDAVRTGPDRVVARTQELLVEARRAKPPLQLAADRVAALFVPLVLVLAVLVLVTRVLLGEPVRGLFDALSVLLISCPCALGLAAPLATHFALARAAALGILVDAPSTLERASAVRRVYFDKTGTLTERRLRLERIEPAEGVAKEQALVWAAAVGSASLHPIAQALHQEAVERELPLPAASEAFALPGLGATAVVDGRRLWLGSARLAARLGIELPQDAGSRESGDVHLLDAQRRLGWFSVSERVRPDARSAIDALHALGVEVAVLTGDREAPARRIAEGLGIGFQASLLPGDKLDRLVEAGKGRRLRTAMVGDGINDAPVLAAADVGIALGSGAAIARRSGGVTLLGDGLLRVPQLLALSRRTMRCIRFNLLWAFAYNLIGLGLAAAGYLTPAFSALAMIGSSLLVLTTSRRAGDTPDVAPRAGRAA